MLQSIRDGLLNHKEVLAYPLLGLLGLVFVAWGAYGIVSFGVGQTSYAAEAGGVKVSAEEARTRYLNLVSRVGGGDIPEALKTQLQTRVLEDLIRNALMSARTSDLGYRVSDAELIEQIRKEPAFQVGGQFSPDAAKAALAQAGLSMDRYEDDLRTQMRTQQLAGGIVDSDFVTPLEQERARTLQGQERQVRYAVLSPEKFPGAAPNDADIQAYYTAHQAQYMIPETAHLQYAEARLDSLAQQIAVSDADLKALYDKELSRFQEPERRHARHILITVDQGRDDAAAQKLANDILAQLKAGKDFAALAKQYSADTGSADSGGDLGFQDKKTFVGPFADALFSMKVGETKGPVKSEFGYHIIKLEEIQAAKGKTFEEARPDLVTQLKKDKATDRFGDLQEQLQTKLEQPGATLESVAKEMNLTIGEVAQYEHGTGGAPLGASPELQPLVFGDQALPIGKLGGPVLDDTQGQERLLIVKVLERKKAEPKPLASVRASIVEALSKERATEAAYKAADAARAKLDAGASFESVIKELGVSADPARFVSRTDASILPELRDAAFEAPRPAGKPSYQTVKLSSGGAAVLAVTQTRLAPLPAKEEAHKEAMKAAQASGESDWGAYIEQLRNSATVRTNLKVFE